MSAEEGYFSNPGLQELSHRGDGVSNSRAVRQPPSRRHSEEKPSAPAHQVSYLSMLTNQRQISGGNEEDGITAATAEAMKNFSFEKAARNSEMNEIRQRGSTSHASLHPELARNGVAPFATRHSQQFIPQKTLNVYDLVQGEESRAVTKPDKLRHEATFHRPRHEAQRDAFARGIRPVPHNGAGQPSSSLQKVAFHVTPHPLSSNTTDARPFLIPTGLSDQAAHRTGTPNEHSEDLYDEGEQAENGDIGAQGQEGDLGDDFMNDPAGCFRSSEFGEEQDLEQAPGREQYTEQSHDHAQPTDPISSRDSSAAPSPISRFSAGFTTQFEDYARTHQQDAQDAEERWRNATIEEWKAGKFGK